MADANAHINYSLEDIERYLKGGMNAKEMHDIEKAALQDPFLADAIEGYREASLEQSRKHLNEINALLQKDGGETKVVTMPVKSFQWWKAAAMIIVLTGVGLLSWYIIGLNTPVDDAQTVMAVKENNTPVTKDSQAAIAGNDTPTTLIAQQKATRQHVEADAPPKEMQEAEKEIAYNRKKEGGNLAAFKNADVTVDKQNFDTAHFNFKTAPGLQISEAKDDSPSLKTFAPMQGRSADAQNSNIALNQFSGIVTDKDNTPVPNAFVSAGRQQATVTDKNGYFSISAPDSALQVSVSSAGYETINTNLSKSSVNRIAIEPDRQSLSEVVVSGYGKKKEANKVYNKTADSAFPAGGWESFQEYVYKKINKPFDSSNNKIIKIHGNVEIEFSINEAGDPYNFNVLKSSGKENDEKAIQALKEGPRWITSKKNKTKKGKVVISF